MYVCIVKPSYQEAVIILNVFMPEGRKITLDKKSAEA